MSPRSKVQRSGQPPGTASYKRRFMADVHHLIGQGFQAISHLELQDREEPAITGLLTDSIEAFLDDSRSPDWTERYSIQDERHLNDDLAREGKRRPRVDIEFAYSGKRPRPRFQVEAKRLRDPASSSVSAYLGENGLGCFLKGRYAAQQMWAGMMAYIQTEAPSIWVDRIRASLSENPSEFSILPKSGILTPANVDDLLPNVLRSDHLCHERQPSRLEVHHFFVDCC